MQQTFGPTIHDDGTTTFRLWAPQAEAANVIVADRAPESMAPSGDGFFEIRADACAGELYGFDIGIDKVLPDPASRFQPNGVHGRSQLIELCQCETFGKGLSKKDLIIYELHVGTFTDAGTYESAGNRLPELVDLGVTAVELMPLAQSAGEWNWGYDGVYFYAPHHACGTPGDLRSFIHTAHSLGLAVILDVVYNHFGPEGNYLGLYGGYLSKKHSTPWGDAPNSDGEGSAISRRFLLENIEYWIELFGFDGLRLDATHCIADTSDRHIVREIGETCRGLEMRLGRTIHLIAESNIYDPELIVPLDKAGYGFDGLWCDDFAHSVYAALEPGQHRSDRAYEPGSDLDLILRRGYVFHGTLKARRKRHLLEEYPDQIQLESVVSAIQNHDFIGNHPAGLRLHQTTSLDAQRAAATLLLLSPSIPMLFMGEEFASDSPFYFFADFGDPSIRTAVERGRRLEHPQHDWKHAVSPLSGAAFIDSKIGEASEGNTEMRKWYQELIAIRKTWIESGYLCSGNLDASWDIGHSVGVLRYRTGESDEQRFLVVRLHPVDKKPTPLSTRIGGKILLSHNYDSKRNCAGSFAIIVGTGSVELS